MGNVILASGKAVMRLPLGTTKPWGDVLYKLSSDLRWLIDKRLGHSGAGLRFKKFIARQFWGIIVDPDEAADFFFRSGTFLETEACKPLESDAEEIEFNDLLNLMWECAKEIYVVEPKTNAEIEAKLKEFKRKFDSEWNLRLYDEKKHRHEQLYE